MAQYIIYKKAPSVFEIVKDNLIFISDSKWSGTQIDGRFTFKSENGARLFANVPFSEVSYVDETGGGSVSSFASAISLHNKLKEVGFFDASVSSGGGGADTFKQLADTFSSFTGRNGQVIYVDGNVLNSKTIANNELLSQLGDTNLELIQNIPAGHILQVVTIIEGDQTIKRWAAVPFPTQENTPPNGYLQLGTVTRDGSDVNVSTGYLWIIDGIQLGNSVAYDFVIEDAEAGDSRVDIIVANNDGSFSLIQGEPSEGSGTAVAPVPNTQQLLLTTISIYEDNISEPVNPITGLYITKESLTYQEVNTDEDSYVIPNNGHSSYLIQNLGSDSTISGVSRPSFVAGIENVVYDGNTFEFLIDNDITIFENGADIEGLKFILAKNFSAVRNSVVTFKLKGGDLYFKSYSEFGDYIKRSGTEPGKPVTGDIEYLAGNDNKLFSRNSDDNGSGSVTFGDGNVSLGYAKDGGIRNSITANEEGLRVDSNDANSKGLIGDRLFDKQGDPNAYAQIGDLGDTISIDSVPTAGSSNAVSSGGTFTALGTKITNGGQNGTVAIGPLDNSFFYFIQNGTTRARFGGADFELTSGGSFSATNPSEGAFFPGSNVASPKISTSRGSSSMPTLIVDNNDSASTGRIIEFRKNGVAMAGVNPDGTVTGSNATASNNFVPLGQLNSKLKDNQLSKQASYTILMSDFVLNNHLTIFVNATLAAITITLPAALSSFGYTITVIKTDSSANSITVKGNGSELINALNTFILSAEFQRITTESNGLTNYIRST